MSQSFMQTPFLIAHACGEINGTIYSNSLEAFNASYYDKKHKCYEIDINLSADNEFVLIHDFNKTYEYLFGDKLTNEITLEEFLKLKIKGKYTPLSLDNFCDLALQHPDIYIVSDCKLKDNIAFLEYIDRKYPQLKDRFLIQAYHAYELPLINDLGFKQVILTNYRHHFSYDEIVNLYQKHNLIGVAFGKEIAQDPLLAKLKSVNLNIFVHTVNEMEEIELLKQQGVQSFFTDSLY